MDFKKLTKLEVTTSIKIINLLQIKYQLIVTLLGVGFSSEVKYF